VRIVTSLGHSIVQFEMDGDAYYADLLNEWDSVDALDEFMETSKPF
jgi:hypothetical protein